MPLCKKCKDTGIDPHCSESDGLWVKGYCDCQVADDLYEKEMCFGCGEYKKNCICGQEAQLRATSLLIIKSVVGKYGGTVEIDLATDTINIDVPKEHEVSCAQEIEEQIGNMSC